jgi:4-amino-4-deoxy-L-arabinose transferase-like glycosyltransferase
MNLTEVNRRISTRKPIWTAALLLFLAFLSFHVLPESLRQRLVSPPNRGDSPDYDAIALQLSKKASFSYDWDDQDYRAPYAESNGSGKYDYLLARSGGGVTAYRPPLLPILMATSYRVFGRQFWPIRLFLGVCLALTCALSFVVVSRRFGIFPGLLGALWFFVDPRFGQFARSILTEALAALGVTVMFLLLLQLQETRSWKTALWLGAATGVAFLARSAFFLWTPILGVAVYVLGKPRTAKWFSTSSLRLPVFFLASFVAVSAPWMLRNCYVLKGFQPLGTMGSISLSEAYSDTSFKRKGLWYSSARAGLFDQLELEGKSLIEQEGLKAAHSRQMAIDWIFRNPWKVPLLAFYKVHHLWEPKGVGEALLLALGGLGFLAFLSIRPRDALCVLAFLVACTFAVSITWSVRGRFLVPLLPLLAALAGLGAWCLVVAWVELPIERLRLRADSVSSASETAE